MWRIHSIGCTRTAVAIATAVVAVLVLTTCGAGGGGAEGNEDLTLLQFSLDGVGNVALNRRLVFSFTCDVDPGSVSSGTIQIREGSAFGHTVRGTFDTQGQTVFFLPEIPQGCNLHQAEYEGLLPDTEYRVTLVGYPEEHCLRAKHDGRELTRTSSFGFHTCKDNDPELFVDQIPGTAPAILSVSIANGSAAVEARDGNELRISFSENLDPCTVHEDSVRFHIYELGDCDTEVEATGDRFSGFDPVHDNSPDPYSWGSTAPVTRLSPPQRIPSEIVLTQGYEGTEIVVSPLGGRFPENALLVLELSVAIRDFGGSVLPLTKVAFTTENQPCHERVRVVEFEGETQILEVMTTADVDSGRSPSRAQAWFAFAGDGDNGMDVERPAGPLPCLGQLNDGLWDDFDPEVDTTFDTGGAVNTCSNQSDGSKAVVWELNSFRLRAGRTLRFVGENPVLLLVRNDVVIESGATVLVRGAYSNQPPPHADGMPSQWILRGDPFPATAHGGRGVAGGGSGGSSVEGYTQYGQDGVAGVGSSEARVAGGHGAGLGGVAVTKELEPNNGGSAGGGGGGAHTHDGDDGESESSPYAVFKGVPRSDGGERYPTGDVAQRLLLPSAGSGGGAGGWMEHQLAGPRNGPSGGGGGAGGGFLAIACGGDLTVAGTINASGGDGGMAIGIRLGGGNGGQNYLAWSGGSGGGAGGGILLMTSQDIVLSASTVITTAGGMKGPYKQPQMPPPPYNLGGNGSPGRVVLEDGDSVMPGLEKATLVPTVGQPGFYRGLFDAGRFRVQNSSTVVTQPFFVGSIGPVYLAPEAADLRAGVPRVGAPGVGRTAILVEVRGFPLLATGVPDETRVSPWYTVGHHRDSGTPEAPTWHPGVEPGDVPRPPDNVGPDITNLNVPGSLPYLQIRMTFFLSDTMGLADPGAFVDAWRIRFEEDL